MKGLIVTGDDFGISYEVNEAIETAHLHGVLNTASLLVAGKAADDAIRRAKRLPSLHVGLHLAVTRSRSVLPAQALRAMTDHNGCLPGNLALAGIRFFCLPAARRQLEEEVRAQFDLFCSSGLHLDHVNVHNHMHLHPTVFGLLLRVGNSYGIPAIRLPWEPVFPAWRAVRKAGIGRRLAMAMFLAPWLMLLRYRLHRAGIPHNDYLFGMNDSGHMTIDRVLQLLTYLPDGVSEMHFHPATESWQGMDMAMDGYEQLAELEALTSTEFDSALSKLGIHTTSFESLGISQRRQQDR